MRTAAPSETALAAEAAAFGAAPQQFTRPPDEFDRFLARAHANAPRRDEAQSTERAEFAHERDDRRPAHIDRSNSGRVNDRATDRVNEMREARAERRDEISAHDEAERAAHAHDHAGNAATSAAPRHGDADATSSAAQAAGGAAPTNATNAGATTAGTNGSTPAASNAAGAVELAADAVDAADVTAHGAAADGSAEATDNAAATAKTTTAPTSTVDAMPGAAATESVATAITANATTAGDGHDGDAETDGDRTDARPTAGASDTPASVRGTHATPADNTAHRAQEPNPSGTAAGMPNVAVVTATNAPAANRPANTAITAVATAPTAAVHTNATEGAEATAVASRPAPVADQVLDAILPLRNRADGDYHVKLELRPAELGRVELTVELRNGVLSVHMHADNAAARDVLQHQLDRMREMLQERGVRTGSLDVGDQHNAAPRDGSDRSNNNGTRRTSDNGRDASRAPDPVATSRAPRPAQPVDTTSANRLDLRV